jgi:hypothetical protein
MAVIVRVLVDPPLLRRRGGGDVVTARIRVGKSTTRLDAGVVRDLAWKVIEAWAKAFPLEALVVCLLDVVRLVVPVREVTTGTYVGRREVVVPDGTGQRKRQSSRVPAGQRMQDPVEEALVQHPGLFSRLPEVVRLAFGIVNRRGACASRDQQADAGPEGV